MDHSHNGSTSYLIVVSTFDLRFFVSGKCAAFGIFLFPVLFLDLMQTYI